MNAMPVYSVEVTRLQRAVGQACTLLAELGDTADLLVQPRAACARVSRLTAYGASAEALDEAVAALRYQATYLELRLEAIQASAMIRRRALLAALTTIEEASLARANGWGSAGACPATTTAKTPAAGESVGRVAAGSAAASATQTGVVGSVAPPTPPTERTAQRTAGGGIGR